MTSKERKLRALFVGVEKYDDDGIQNLRYAIDDAYALQALFKRLDFTTTCLDDPDRGEVLDAITTMTEGMGRGDVFLFFFSGHGFSIGGEDLIFCPKDRIADLAAGQSAGLAYSILRARTTKAQGQFDRIFIFDTCRSYLTGRKGVGGHDDVTLRTGEKIGTRDLAPLGNFVGGMCGSAYVMRSCCSGQESLEIPSGNGANGNGLFTLSLISAMESDMKAHHPISFDSRFQKNVLFWMNEHIKAHKPTWEQVPEFRTIGFDIQLGGSALGVDSVAHGPVAVRSCSCEYDGRPHGVELCEPPPEGAKVSYSMDGGRTRTHENPQFIEVCSHPVHVWVETKEGLVSEGEGYVTIRARRLQNWMVHGTDVIVKPDGSAEPKLTIEDVAPHRLEAGKDWRVAECRQARNGYEVAVEGMRNYCGRLTVSIPNEEEHQKGSSEALRDLCDQYRVMLKESAEFHADPEQNRPELRTKLIGWQDELYVISGGAKKRATIRVAELDKLISAVIAEFRAFRREFDNVPFFIEHRRQKVELIAKKLLHDSVAEIFYKSVTIQMEDE